MTHIDLADVAVDTEGWRDVCIGYHTVMVPPGLNTSHHPSTHIDWHYPEVVRGFDGSARAVIEQDRRYGGTVFQTHVNGWEFVVARLRRSESRVSTRMLTMYGARKIGTDVVFFTEPASISIVGDGSDPKYRAFYANLTVELETAENRSTGFCYDGFVFSGYTPTQIYTFMASFVGKQMNGRGGFQFDRHGYSLRMHKSLTEPPPDDRPPAPEPTAALFPTFEFEQTNLKRDGSNGYILRISGTGEESDRHGFKTVIAGRENDLKSPILFIDTVDDIHPATLEEGRAELLSFLASIKSN